MSPWSEGGTVLLPTLAVKGEGDRCLISEEVPWRFGLKGRWGWWHRTTYDSAIKIFCSEKVPALQEATDDHCLDGEFQNDRSFVASGGSLTVRCQRHLSVADTLVINR